MENHNAVFVEKRGNQLVSVHFDDLNSKYKREISIDFERFIPKGSILPGLLVNAEVSCFIDKDNRSQQGIESNKKYARNFLKNIISVIRSGGQLYVCSDECGKYICELSRRVNVYNISNSDVLVVNVSGLKDEKIYGFDFNQLPHSALCKTMCLQFNQFMKTKVENKQYVFANLHVLDDGTYKVSTVFKSKETAFKIGLRQNSYVKTLEIPI